MSNPRMDGVDCRDSYPPIFRGPLLFQPKKQESVSTSDKLEIPQDVIDSISGASSSEDSENE